MRSIFNKSNPNDAPHPFWVMVRKDISDHVSGWRYNILLIIMALTCLGSLYTATMTIREAAQGVDSTKAFLFLKLFTISDPEGTLPPFITFVSFLGPLIGLALGFDAVNSERNKGTLNRIMSQPVHRDYLINAKFVSSLFVISVIFFALSFLVMGLGLFFLGIPITPEEFLRVLSFVILSIVYVAFWLNLAILFSVRFRQPATSALSGIAVWIFFSVFYNMIVNILTNSSQGQAAGGRAAHEALFAAPVAKPSL